MRRLRKQSAWGGGQGVSELAVLFIRHGESEANRDNVLVSRAYDPALTPVGHREAEWVARPWQDHSVTAIYSSPLRRARETAAAFLNGRAHLSVVVDARLHEIALGRWDGLPIPRIEETDGERFLQWKQDPQSGAPDGGEALSTVGSRVAEFLEAVRTGHRTGLVIAVTHADCLKALVLMTLHAPWEAAAWLHMANTAGVYVVWRANKWQIVMFPPMPLTPSDG